MTTVRESAAQRDGLFGVLVLVFVAALVRGVAGASTTAGRVAVLVIFGALVVGISVAWIARRRHAFWLEVTDDTITLAGARSARGEQLTKSAGADLHFVTTGSYRSRSLALTQGDGHPPLTLQFFSRTRVRAACLAHDWRCS